MPDAVDRDLIMIRYSPFTPERMQVKATIDHDKDLSEGKDPKWALSLWGTKAGDGETMVEAGQRLAKDLLEYDRAPNGDKISIATAGTLIDQGFSVHLDEPPRGHYVVGQGDFYNEPDYEALSKVFKSRYKNPALPEGEVNA